MSSNNNNITTSNDTEQYRDKIATVDEKGKRLWIYPKKPKGRFYNARTYVSWGLLAFLFLGPFIKINGHPLLLLNILERKFVLFGIPFMPQDFHLFVLAMLTFIVFIILFTVVFGRLFCGWVCPQTIFMELVFRKIEYLIEGDANAQRRLNKAPWTTQKIIKKGAKQAIFFAIAVLVANTFLAYIIGIEDVLRIASEPVSQNFGGFIAMILFSFAFYFVFSYMREQVCVAICPYGRLQGVLLDQNSIVVAYDYVRGEPRGKIKKNRKTKSSAIAKTNNSSPSIVTNPVAEIQTAVSAPVEVNSKHEHTLAPGNAPSESIKKALGDCIDCKLCVHVCPTGIDIRDGTQLECINCTACMDACDEVMDKVGRERGLIRYDSHDGIAESKHRIFTPRVIAYSFVLFILLAVNAFLLTSRSDVETIILRTPGMIYQKVDETHLSNLYNYQIINKTSESFPVEFKLVGIEGEIKLIGEAPQSIPEDVAEGAFFIHLHKDDLKSRKTKLNIEVYSNGELIDQTTTNFLGPMK